MKKLFWVFTLIAAVATGFMGCKKTANDSDTHTQKYTSATTFRQAPLPTMTGISSTYKI